MSIPAYPALLGLSGFQSADLHGSGCPLKAVICGSACESPSLPKTGSLPRAGLKPASSLEPRRARGIREWN